MGYPNQIGSQAVPLTTTDAVKGGRLGLYGGSFDPVHLGHVLVAKAALEELGLDQLIFLPAARSPFKSAQIPAPDAARLRWLRLALSGCLRFRVDDREIQRGGVSYSMDTVRDFRSSHPTSTLYWLIGADQVSGLPAWHEAEALAHEVTFVVIPRPGEVPPTLPTSFRMVSLQGWPLALSSSIIRQRLKEGRSIRYLVPEPLAEVLPLEHVYLT